MFRFVFVYCEITDELRTEEWLMVNIFSRRHSLRGHRRVCLRRTNKQRRIEKLSRGTIIVIRRAIDTRTSVLCQKVAIRACNQRRNQRERQAVSLGRTSILDQLQYTTADRSDVSKDRIRLFHHLSFFFFFFSLSNRFSSFSLLIVIHLSTIWSFTPSSWLFYS